LFRFGLESGFGSITPLPFLYVYLTVFYCRVLKSIGYARLTNRRKSGPCHELLYRQKAHIEYYHIIVVFDCDDDKNEQLKTELGISFEQIVFLILNDRILDILEHPNKVKYGNQKLYVIDVDGYAYVVPFEDRKGVRFLKTILPSRKYTQKYLRREGEQK